MRLGKRNFTYEVRDAEGNLIQTIPCAKTVYRRRDGSLYILTDENRRQDLTRNRDGSLSLIEVRENLQIAS